MTSTKHSISPNKLKHLDTTGRQPTFGTGPPRQEPSSNTGPSGHTSDTPAHIEGMSNAQPRKPAGSTEGGQFAANQGSETSTTLPVSTTSVIVRGGIGYSDNDDV